VTTEIRNLPIQDQRIETGVVQFGDDWPGVFIRGDDCFGYVMCFKGLIAKMTDEQKKSFDFKGVKKLFQLLYSSNISPAMPDKFLE